MKAFFVLAALAIGATAQTASFLIPQPNATIAPGSTVTIQIHQDESLSDDVQLGIAIGLATCFSGSCANYDPSQDGMGTILYNGPFNPQHDPSDPEAGLQERFNLTFPGSTGPSVLSVVQMQAVGAVKVPTFNVADVVIKIAN
ncbi:hypothetical protein CERSUDRAFT_116762 [Gelatoporia subvermispora B]|uniref:Secreted protein n=1 Tax=Ceriporiopsis subvermispora (strain B) TaxID=914234 RepID=M2QQY9_CERS8|nr:hypothetical protein CERSUDRAFT_116762 [Gelatoporia subvermispora B]